MGNKTVSSTCVMMESNPMKEERVEILQSNLDRVVYLVYLLVFVTRLVFVKVLGNGQTRN